MKKLKKYNHFRQYGEHKDNEFFILATSRKNVVELLEKVGIFNIGVNTVKNYFHEAWGDQGEELLKNEELTEPCIYIVKSNGLKLEGEPTKLI